MAKSYVGFIIIHNTDYSFVYREIMVTLTRLIYNEINYCNLAVHLSQV